MHVCVCVCVCVCMCECVCVFACVCLCVYLFITSIQNHVFPLLNILVYIKNHSLVTMKIFIEGTKGSNFQHQHNVLRFTQS